MPLAVGIRTFSSVGGVGAGGAAGGREQGGDFSGATGGARRLMSYNDFSFDGPCPIPQQASEIGCKVR
jgi:hypothetical protein